VGRVFRQVSNGIFVENLPVTKNILSVMPMKVIPERLWIVRY
jgi:hypothetical protein